jgi:hypothetical protein
MRRRIYYLLPNVASSRKAMDDLLLARIEERHIHSLAKRDTPMDGLHEASVLQKTDMAHGAQIGLVLGALLGLGASALFVRFAAPGWQIATIVGMVALGALYGTWVASMVGASVPNCRLRKFESPVEKGMVLLMIDVPEHNVEEVKMFVGKSHPEAVDHGLEPDTPVFP